jgi:hypothetical protein
VDLGIQFCERCGRDRDALVGARAAFRDCPSCGAACCPDCWNLVDAACLACAPFRLRAETSRSRVVAPEELAAVAGPNPSAPGQAAPSAAGPGGDVGSVRVVPATDGHGAAPGSVDPYAELRGTAPSILGGWEGTRATARQRPREAPASGAAPSADPDAWRAVVAAAEPPRVRRPRRRAGRLGLSAAVAWVVVVGLAVAALGASPDDAAAVPVAAPPSATPTVAPTATPVPTASPRPSPKPKPKPARAPRATPRPERAPAAAPPASNPKPAPRATPRPVKPVVVAPPPAATPQPTPEYSPEATPQG